MNLKHNKSVTYIKNNVLQKHLQINTILGTFCFIKSSSSIFSVGAYPSYNKFVTTTKRIKTHLKINNNNKATHSYVPASCVLTVTMKQMKVNVRHLYRNIVINVKPRSEWMPLNAVQSSPLERASRRALPITWHR